MMAPQQQNFSQGIHLPSQNVTQNQAKTQPTWKERLNSNKVIDITKHLPEEERDSYAQEDKAEEKDSEKEEQNKTE